MTKERNTSPLARNVAIMISLIAIVVSIFSLSHNISAEKNQRECDFLYRQLDRMSNISERIPSRSSTLLLWMSVRINAEFVKQDKIMDLIGEQSLRATISENIKEILTNYTETERLLRIVNINRHFLEDTTVSDSGMTLGDMEDILEQELDRLNDLVNESDLSIEILAQSVKELQDIILKYHSFVDKLVLAHVEMISARILSSCN